MSAVPLSHHARIASDSASAILPSGWMTADQSPANSIEQPDLSVILCTQNPRADILELVLDSLQSQTLAAQRWELIVIDNNCDPPLDAEKLRGDRELPIRLVRENQTGLIAARRRGAACAAADLVVLVDDDNILDPDYLETALAIAKSEPQLGAFGGPSRALLEHSELSRWKTKLLPYLGIRDYGLDPITSNQDTWGHWEPIGAGMVVRKQVLEKFSEYLRVVPTSRMLGRCGQRLLSGDDSLIARSAYRVGYCCSYQPKLKLGHYIRSDRVRMRYLVRILFGHGRSSVILNNVLGIPFARMGYPELLARLIYRVFKHGVSGAICWAWDIGYLVESRRGAGEPAPIGD
jgi:glycosyltransferase involved in cell wall biosynthesis